MFVMSLDFFFSFLVIDIFRFSFSLHIAKIFYCLFVCVSISWCGIRFIVSCY